MKTVASEKYKVEHPFIPEINHIYGTIIDNDPNTKEGTQVNVVYLLTGRLIVRQQVQGL